MPRAAASPPINVGRLLRRLHGYLGMLIAPSVLFFACTGSLQLFSLHEAHGDYTPPALFVTLGSLHKDQRLPKRRDPPMAAARPASEPPRRHEAPRAPKIATLALKILFLMVALGLILSTCIGLWMAQRDRARRGLNLVLLAVGFLAPLALILSLT